MEDGEVGGERCWAGWRLDGHLAQLHAGPGLHCVGDGSAGLGDVTGGQWGYRNCYSAGIITAVNIFLIRILLLVMTFFFLECFQGLAAWRGKWFRFTLK